MAASVIVRDIETVPDSKGFAAANGSDGSVEQGQPGKHRSHPTFLKTCGSDSTISR
jgi:hypothetical protein